MPRLNEARIDQLLIWRLVCVTPATEPNRDNHFPVDFPWERQEEGGPFNISLDAPEGAGAGYGQSTIYFGTGSSLEALMGPEQDGAATTHNDH
ncbi:hypothetical protein EYF80_026200 [Liparis tanakae]|uniref:Uncharacterized protein n=1 Tax=Liparis tanakae TaxID=230148 RepID=A0A4Z2HCF2_9TELE|nr:hypothetical protein EYF80_026200 [Liparis tanakae]